MKVLRIALVGLAFLLTNFPLQAQEKPKDEKKSEAKDDTKAETKGTPTALKVQIVIAESLGGKKVSSVPFTVYLEAYDHDGPAASIRTEDRYSWCCAKDGNQWHYPTTSNMDIRARVVEGGRYDIKVFLFRTWWEWNGANIGEGQLGTVVGTPERHEEPTSRQIETAFNLLMRDEQSLVGYTSTDPWTGKVFSVTITINVLK